MTFLQQICSTLTPTHTPQHPLYTKGQNKESLNKKYPVFPQWAELVSVDAFNTGSCFVYTQQIIYVHV